MSEPLFESAVNAWLADDTDPPGVIIAARRDGGHHWEWHRLTMEQADQLAGQLQLLTKDWVLSLTARHADGTRRPVP